MITSFEGKYSFLSNFYACQTEYHNVKYPTSQAAKNTEGSNYWHDNHFGSCYCKKL